MDLLSTAFALLTLCACGFLTWQSHVNAEDARDSCDELRAARALLKSNQLAMDNFHLQLRRLNGRVNEVRGKMRAQLVQDAPEDGLDDYRNDYRPPDPQAMQLDPELAAELALQNAPAVSPGKS